MFTFESDEFLWKLLYIPNRSLEDEVRNLKFAFLSRETEFQNRVLAELHLYFYFSSLHLSVKDFNGFVRIPWFELKRLLEKDVYF